MLSAAAAAKHDLSARHAALGLRRRALPRQGAGSTVVKVGVGDVDRSRTSRAASSARSASSMAMARFNSAGLVFAFASRAQASGYPARRTSESAQRTLAALKRRGVDLAEAETALLFGESSPPGARAELTIALDGLLIVAAPGAAMAPALRTRRRQSSLGSRAAAAHRGAAFARADGRSGAGFAHQGCNRVSLFRPGRRIHPDHRRRRPAMYGFPGLCRPQGRQGAGPGA